jgi:hypothetical protein
VNSIHFYVDFSENPLKTAKNTHNTLIRKWRFGPFWRPVLEPPPRDTGGNRGTHPQTDQTAKPVSQIQGDSHVKQ